MNNDQKLAIMLNIPADSSLEEITAAYELQELGIKKKTLLRDVDSMHDRIKFVINRAKSLSELKDSAYDIALDEFSNEAE